MIFFFDFPSHLDKAVLKILPQKLNSYDPQEILVKEVEFLGKVDELRQQFNLLTNKEHILKIISQKDGLLNYQKTMDEYLKTNVDMLTIIGFKKCNHPQFQYKTFLSHNKKIYSTENESNQVACAAEILLARYNYAFAFQLDAFQCISQLRSHIQDSFDQENLVKTGEVLVSNITKCLKRFAIGYNQIKKVYNVMPDLLSFLIDKQQILIPELKSTTVLCIKNLCEVHANSLYSEQLRFLKEYKSLSQLCKTSYDKLNQIYIRFSEIKNEINQEILVFVQSALIFFQAYALWALNRTSEIDIKNEDYGDKNFTILSLEVLSLSKQIIRLSEKYYSIQADTDYYDYGKLFFQKLFVPPSSKNIQLYQDIYHQKVQEPEADYIFNSIKEPLDYYEIVMDFTK